MRILLQRVLEARVEVDGEVIGEIDQGMLLLAGFCHRDDALDLTRAVSKVVNLRIYPDHNDRLHHNITDINGEILLVPQFTLYANTGRGRRPDFVDAMRPDLATQKFDELVAKFRSQTDLKIATGKFGADMKVGLVNDGPFTLNLEF